SEQSRDYYMIHPYGMQLQSDYHTLGNFFAEIGQMDRVFNIKNLSMNLSGEESEKKLSSGFSILTYTFKQ
ncbi:MAG: type 4a pilus biogenesis protein PilO, partial [Elusimicrobiota bacterium]